MSITALLLVGMTVCGGFAAILAYLTWDSRRWRRQIRNLRGRNGQG